ncbi:hypothetical protein [Nostoc sp. UIC 10630]|uniref:hypothetical protein n=1 Tax=Nostoc sp. UIC 10630 TaxID=2100146 RepID=UPI0013D13B2B|nr:hypothetical protein [Nostoc sp. UIC 10630]NEU82780.1 hypothetical protein [Nostoc sp. UIC 10630]
MKFLKTSLVIVSSLGLIFLGACSGGNQATNSESASKTATTETAAQTEPVAKTGEAHNENEGHAHDEKDGHSNSGEHKGQVIESGKYHLEFKPDIKQDSTHLNISLHGEQDKAITDAKLTAQVQLPDGSNKTLQVPYNTEEKQYTAKLPATATGEYKIVIQTDVKGKKFNGRFTFKR